jgi:hypothetical protein
VTRRVRLVGSLVIFLCVIVEGLSFLVIAVSPRLLREEIRRTKEVLAEQSSRIRQLMESSPKHLLLVDPPLGWRYRAGYRDPRNQLNEQGVRSARIYAAAPGAGIVRVAAFGDSFVYCNEVGDADSWPALMESLAPRFEVLNYGVGGYGTDQAYLRFMLEGGVLTPDVVIIGFAPVDLGRVVNVYRRFISNRELPLVKPRFVLGPDGDLSLVPNPVERAGDYARYLAAPRTVFALGDHDHWYEPVIYENPFYDLSATVRVATTLWVRARRRFIDADRLLVGDGLLRPVTFNAESTAFRIQAALLKKFRDAVRASGAVPVVVIFPDRDSVVAARRGRPTVYDPLTAYLKGAGIGYVDLGDAFASATSGADVQRWFMPGGHYSGEGNRIAASWLVGRLGQSVRTECGAGGAPARACRRLAEAASIR